MKKVLVTGGAGFIGSHLVERLVSEGIGVTVLDNLSTGIIWNLSRLGQSRNLRIINGDILIHSDVISSLKEVDSVAHLAAIASVPESIKYPMRTHRTNVEGTKALLEASESAGVEKFVFISTCAVYGNTRKLPVNENHPMKPLSPYASSKLDGEKLCIDHSEKFVNGVTILRFFNVYGPRQTGTVIFNFTECLKARKRPKIYGDGSQTRDFLHVTDAVEAIVLALRQEGNGTYNIGSGKETSIIDLERTISRELGVKRVTPRFYGARPGEVYRSVADIARARTELGFNPATQRPIK